MNIKPLSQLKQNFNSELETTTDKNLLIENELREINNFINYTPIPKSGKGVFMKYYPPPKSTGVFNINISQYQRAQFTLAFNNYVSLGENDIQKNYHEPEEAYIIRKNVSDQAKEFFNYYQWLISLKEKPKSTQKKSSLDHKEKLLALHYLGLDLSKFDNKKTAKILSEIIGHSEENTRKYLSYLTAGKNNVRTPKTLKNTLNLFESQGFNDISNTIKADLEKITK